MIIFDSALHILVKSVNPQALIFVFSINWHSIFDSYRKRCDTDYVEYQKKECLC